MSFLKRLFGKMPVHHEPVPQEPVAAISEQSADDRLWDDVHDARVQAFETGFGKLPQDIQKLVNLTGIWPGGGLYVIPAPQLRAGAAVYASFGLTNPDMPSRLTIGQSETTVSENGERLECFKGTIAHKEQPPPVRAWPGYGYEIVVVADENEEWPLWLLQWAVQAEILNDVGMRDRMDTYGGMTVESVRMSEDAAWTQRIAGAFAGVRRGAVQRAGACLGGGLARDWRASDTGARSGTCSGLQRRHVARRGTGLCRARPARKDPQFPGPVRR